MLKKFIIIILILIVATSNSFAQEINIKLSEILNIGNYEDGPEEYLFAGVHQICTDNMNNIYVADRNMSKIRVFDCLGKFIKYIGRKGQGPGEMQEISCLTIDYNNNLIVVDKMNKRITKFIDMGERIETFPFIEKTWIEPQIIRSLNSESYLLYYLKKIQKNNIQAEDKLIHLYDKKFSNIKKSMLSSGEIWDFTKPFFRTEPGSYYSLDIFVINEEKIILSPAFYEGILYIYKKQGEDWYINTIQGKKPPNGSYKLLNPNDYTDGKEPKNVLVRTGPFGRFMVQQFSKSKGVFLLNDGKIIHFFRTLQKNDDYILNAELFNQEGKFLGYSTISEQTKENKRYYSYFLWKDKDDRFYVSAFSEVPFVSVVKFDIKIKN